MSAISRNPRVKAVIDAAVNSVVTRASAGQEGPRPMEQEIALGERINKTPFFVTGVVNMRLFLKWLKEGTSEDGGTRMQGDNLVHVPNTTDCFRATVRVLRSIDASNGVIFYD